MQNNKTITGELVQIISDENKSNFCLPKELHSTKGSVVVVEIKKPHTFFQYMKYYLGSTPDEFIKIFIIPSDVEGTLSEGDIITVEVKPLYVKTEYYSLDKLVELKSQKENEE